ncbi:hypothetical protein [Nocardiopsis sp. CNT312]|uniref:hypothetical protein n=1 Tax=Nocardiopsis sp. CNT312 TaxID=1137268 RepID=UPI00048D1C5F|nr:hypothetical protein [Nocardiopsis sp. CNT312]
MTAPPEDGTASVDFYALFEVAPDADTPALRTAIDAFILKWQKHVGSRKKELKRRAEDNLELATEGRRILLDPALRAAYDKRRRHRPAAGPDAPDTAGSADGAPGRQSLERAADAYLNDDYKAARFFANRAVEQDPDLAHAWFIIFSASRILGDADGAEIAGTTAARLDPENPTVLRTVGGFLVGQGQPGRGLAMMERGADLDDGTGCGLALAELQSRLHLLDEAADTLRALHRRFPDDTEVRDQLALTLAAQAKNVPQVRSRNRYLITAEDEVTRMGELAGEARRLRPKGMEIRKILAELESAIDEAERERFTFRLFESGGLSAFVWCAAPGNLLLGLVLLVNGVGFGVLLCILSIFFFVMVVAQCRPKGWEANARIKDEQLSYFKAAERILDRGF